MNSKGETTHRTWRFEFLPLLRRWGWVQWLRRYPAKLALFLTGFNSFRSIVVHIIDHPLRDLIAACEKYKDVEDKLDRCVDDWAREHDYGVKYPGGH
jgi:hypothetical protein